MYKIKSLLLMLIALLCSVPMSANIVITMSDSYGDGWNGAELIVQKDGTEIGRATIASGSSSSLTLEHDYNHEYSFYWVKGEYDRECSFSIKLNGTQVLNATETTCSNYSDAQLVYNINAIIAVR